jgi:AraC family transcriptional regulator
MDSYTVEAAVDFRRGSVEVRRYTWLLPVDDTWRLTDEYLLDLSLSPRPGPARGVYIDGEGAQTPEALGRVMFVPPGRTLRTGCSGGHQRSMECRLSSSMINDILGGTPLWHERALREGLHLNNPEIEWLLLKIYRNMLKAGFATEILVESLANALSVELIRYFQLPDGDARTYSGGLPPWRMRLIRERAYAAQPAPSLTELADLCGLTVRHLSRAFKEETGQSIGRFVETVTIERARALLADTQLPVGEIAMLLGFSSSTSFAYAFRRATGLRPSEIRSRMVKRASRAADY